MARLLGPDSASRLITQVVGSTLYEFSGRLATVYTDAAGTQLADIATYDGTSTPGASISGSTVTLDSTSRMPRFWFPDGGVDVLYARPLGGPIVQINADEDARLDALPVARAAAAISDRTQWNTFGTSSTGTTGRTTRTYYVAAVDCVDLTCWWAGVYGDESTALTNSFTLKATIETVSAPQSASGTLYQLTFAGASSVTVAPGQMVRSDPLPINLKRGDGFYVRVYCSVTDSATMVFPLGRQHNPNLFETNVLSSDQTASTGTWTGNNSFSCGPIRIDGTAPSRLPTLAIVGSSTFEGLNDIQDTTTPGGGQYGWGWVRRLCNGNVGLIHTPKASETAQGFTVSRYRARGLLWAGCDYAIEGYGANDINSARTLAQVQADKLRIWTALTARGCKVYTPTIHPTLTTSTDSFATTANQTAAATNSVRTGLNDWIRAGAPIDATTKAAVAVGTSGALVAGRGGHPLTGWLEVADVIETARGTGIYKVGYTTDGQHMTSTAAQAVVAALTNPFV